MSDKQSTSVLRNILKYSSSKIYRQFLGVFTAFIRPRLLTPDQFGLWNILNVLPDYASYVHLGSRSSMRYLIPYYEVKHDYERNRKIKSSVFYGSLYLNLAIATCLVLYSVAKTHSLPVRFGIIAMAVVILLTWYYEYYFSVLKSYQRFDLISVSTYFTGTITFLLSGAFIYFINIYGAFLSLIVTLVLAICYLRRRYPLEPHGGFCYQQFAELIKVGFPIMIFELLTVFMRTSERIVTSYLLGTEQLGYYGIAIMVFNFVISIPGSAREVIEPIFMQDLERRSIEVNFVEYFLKPLINTAYLMPFVIGPIVIILPVLIPLILPGYVQGIRSAQITVLGAYFLSLCFIFRGIIVAQRWQLKASAIVLWGLVVNVSCIVWLLKRGLGLEGVALGSCLSYLVLFLSFLLFIRRMFHVKLPEWDTNINALLWPFPILVITLLLLRLSSSYLHINIYIKTVFDLCVFFISMIGLLYVAQKKYSLLRTLLQIWWEL